MATQHDTMFAGSALEVLFDHHGESVTYTPAQGVAVAVTAVVGAEKIETIFQGDRRIKRRKRTATISVDAASSYGGVASPALSATVTIGTLIYAVAEITPLSGAFVNLTCIRPEPMDRSLRPGSGRR
jgi:hypothetical protein